MNCATTTRRRSAWWTVAAKDVAFVAKSLVLAFLAGQPEKWCWRRKLWFLWGATGLVGTCSSHCYNLVQHAGAVGVGAAVLCDRLLDFSTPGPTDRRRHKTVLNWTKRQHGGPISSQRSRLQGTLLFVRFFLSVFFLFCAMKNLKSVAEPQNVTFVLWTPTFWTAPIRFEFVRTGSPSFWIWRRFFLNMKFVFSAILLSCTRASRLIVNWTKEHQVKILRFCANFGLSRQINIWFPQEFELTGNLACRWVPVFPKK